VIVVVVIHVAAIGWFGVIAQDRARHLARRALLTGDFDALARWHRRERPRIWYRLAISLALLGLLAVLAKTGVYS
jgi:hypothetical protein